MWRWWVVVAVAAVRAVWVLLASEPVISNDSMRYWNPEDPWMVFRLDLAQGPGQLVQVLYLILPPTVAIAVQALAAGLLWGWAAIVAAAGRAWVFLIGVAWSMSPWWLAWDSRVLTESLTLAGVALVAAGVVRLVARPDEARWTPVLAGLGVALLARPLVVVLLMPFVVVALAVREARRRVRAPGVVLVAALLAWSGAQTFVFNTSLAHYHYLPEPQSLARIQAENRFAFRMNVDGYKEEVMAAGLPSCPEVVRILQMRTGEPLQPLREARWTCPELSDWLDAGGLSWSRELLANPLPTLRNVVSWTWGGSGGVTNDPRFAAIPSRALAGVMWAGLGACVVVLLFPGRRWLHRATLVGVCAGVWLVMVMVDGMEYWRHSLPAFAALGPLALAWVGVGVWREQGPRLRGSSVQLARRSSLSATTERA